MDPTFDPFYTPSFTTRTLHVIGRTDVVVVEERSRQLAEVSANKRVEEHDGGEQVHPWQIIMMRIQLDHTGHFVPSKGPWRKFLAAFMTDPTGAHPPPEPVSLSGPSSGTTTPQESGMDYRQALLKKL